MNAGDVLALRGPNGSGKSTLIRLMAGFLSPVMGDIRWEGNDISGSLADHRARLHYVGHADGIKNLLTVRENLAFNVTLNGGTSDVLNRALETFDLGSLVDTPGRFLSSGQRRRLSLARLAAGHRPLWLLDEPGVGLDAANRNRLETAIDRHREDGGMAIIATHGDVEVKRTLVLEMTG